MMRSTYALITGQGRSGTNWLLSLFDVSPATLCRNEPNGNANSLLGKLESERSVYRHHQSRLFSDWDAAIIRTTETVGERDHQVTVPKNHVFLISYILQLHRFFPRHGGESTPPRFIYKSSRFENAFKVIKINQAPGWIGFVLHNRPSVPVFHILRHPGAFLNSWKNRYLAKQSERDVLLRNKERLREVIESDEHWRDRFGDLEALNVQETELLYWCYANEFILDKGKENSEYKLIIYESLAEEVVPIIRESFERCGLEWSRKIELKVKERSTSSPAIAQRWKTELSREEHILVERLLESSPLRTYWGSW